MAPVVVVDFDNARAAGVGRDALGALEGFVGGELHGADRRTRRPTS